MDISEYFCCDNSGTLFHVNSNLIIAKTLAEAELDRQIVVKVITPTKDSNVN